MALLISKLSTIPKYFLANWKHFMDCEFPLFLSFRNLNVINTIKCFIRVSHQIKHSESENTGYVFSNLSSFKLVCTLGSFLNYTEYILLFQEPCLVQCPGWTHKGRKRLKGHPQFGVYQKLINNHIFKTWSYCSDHLLCDRLSWSSTVTKTTELSPELHTGIEIIYMWLIWGSNPL